VLRDLDTLGVAARVSCPLPLTESFSALRRWFAGEALSLIQSPDALASAWESREDLLETSRDKQDDDDNEQDADQAITPVTEAIAIAAETAAETAEQKYD